MRSAARTNGSTRRITRRTFLGAGVVGGAALASGRLPALLRISTAAAADELWLEATIPELQAMLASGQLSSRELVLGYLQRIADLNPLLHAVIETNPQAVAIAAQLDNERRAGHVRGPLHGIPILLKDNIATDDNMQTTAGSLAIYGSRVPGDAVIVERLRAAGAVILGKTNLGEWANFRGFVPFDPDLGALAVGWSARGGNTINPYVLSYTSGIELRFRRRAGREPVRGGDRHRDGRLDHRPSSVENIVGLKPTLGLVSQDGIIPIGHQQDTAGPMARSVSDVAILLGALQSPFGEVIGHTVPADYTQFLQRGALDGARIGRDVRFFDYSYFGYPGDEDTVAFAEHALDVMESLGATIVDTDTGDVSPTPTRSSSRCCSSSRRRSPNTWRR